MMEIKIHDIPNKARPNGDQATQVRNLYKSYFDKQNPRARALGYCVISAGIAINEVGQIDIVFGGPHAVYSFSDGVSYSLKFGEYAIVCRGDGFTDAINAYLASDRRFDNILAGNTPTAETTFVLFKPGTRSRAERIANCETAMWKASKAIGFKHSSVSVTTYSEGFLTPWASPASMVIPSMNRYRIHIRLDK